MSPKDCYIKFGGDFDEVLGRSRREQIVQKLVYKLSDDRSFSLFEASTGGKDYAEALGAVHALKRIYRSLSFIRLFEGSSLTTIALKKDDWNRALDMMLQLSGDYHAVTNAIEGLRIPKEEQRQWTTVKRKIL